MPEEQVEDKNMLLRRAAFGKQIEEFWTSDIGNYILNRIDSEVVAAFKEIKDCDPKDGKVVQMIQNKIYRVESIKGWLEDAVIDGLQAVKELNDF
jgi:hypothetical protein